MKFCSLADEVFIVRNSGLKIRTLLESIWSRLLIYKVAQPSFFLIIYKEKPQTKNTEKTQIQEHFGLIFLIFNNWFYYQTKFIYNYYLGNLWFETNLVKLGRIEACLQASLVNQLRHIDVIN